MARRPHPRSRHARNGGADETPSRAEAPAPRPKPQKRPAAAKRPPGASARRPRRPSSGAKGSHTVLWLLVILAVVLGAGWALMQTMGDENDAPDAAAQADPGLATGDPVMRLTVPEGLRREDIAALLARETELPADRYLELTAPGPRGRALAQADGPTSLEGFLFPATYEIYADTTVDDLVDGQIEAFRANTADIDFRPAARRNLTPFEVLTIASMIEREVVVPAERELVASVIYNRLRAGMSLGIDATVQYAIGEWKPGLTVTDLDVDSPYNTRKFTGLPPGPIASPGRDSIRAAARPRETEFLYYVARFDGSGLHYFSTNAEDFERDVQRSRTNAAAQ